MPTLRHRVLNLRGQVRRIAGLCLLVPALAAAAPTLFAQDMAEESAGLTITLRREASVSAAIITLSDIAALSGPQALVAKAGGAMLGGAPKGPTGKSIASSYIVGRLMALGIARRDFVIKSVGEDNKKGDKKDDAETTVYNAAFVQIEAATESVKQPALPLAAEQSEDSHPNPHPSGEREGAKQAGENEVRPRPAGPKAPTDVVDLALTEIRMRIAEALRVPEADIAVKEVLRNPALRRLPKGVQRLKDVTHADGGTPLGRRVFTLVVEVDGRAFDDLVLTVDVGRYEAVVVANRAVKRGEGLTSDDLRLERRLFTSPAKNYFVEMDKALGLAPERDVQPDAVLIPAELKPAVLVRRGEMVTVRAGLALMKAEAVEDGARGARIRVKRRSLEVGGGSSAAKDVVLYGRVQNDGSVVID